MFRSFNDTSSNSEYGSYPAPAGSRGQVVIHWGAEQMIFELPDPNTPLKVLKQAIASKTGMRPEQMTLYMHGFKMKDENASLERYGLYEPGDGNPSSSKKSSSSFSNLMRGFSNSWVPKRNPPKHIDLVGSPDSSATVSDRLPTASSSSKPAQAPPVKAPPPIVDEASIIANIKTISTNAIDNLKPSMDKYESSIQSGSSTTKSPESTQLYSMISETLLQALLKLDGIEVQSEWTEARAARKKAVKDVQGRLDHIDAVKEQAGQV